MQEIINNRAITTCQGGQIAVKTGTTTFSGGIGGVPSGQGKLINGNNGTATRYNK